VSRPGTFILLADNDTANAFEKQVAHAISYYGKLLLLQGAGNNFAKIQEEAITG
jgi:hypothetical protein